ncbi:MAG TPA: MFS transporter [Acidobacteriaceae bacterium]|nr:MFS transporter [Acidobacteriaceae bacterium]
MAEAGEAALESRTIRRIAWRLIPFLMLLYLIAFLDRINVGFAALTMNRAIGLTPRMYGFGSGIFFLGYVAFEVPSTILQQRVGARFWIGRVMVTWGVVSTAMAFARGPVSFCALRLLLGLAEAGFFPGTILYLSYWFPQRYRSVATAAFMAAAPLAGAIGSPISGALLGLSGVLGLQGWQWLFLMEGLPAIVVGVIAVLWLRDGPADAEWLEEEERRWLTKEMAREEQHAPHESRLWRGLLDWRNLALSLAYFGTSAGLYTIGFWAPLILHRFGFSGFRVGLLVAVPNLVAVAGMLAWSHNSDRTGERYWHAALACAIAAAGMAIAADAGASAVIAVAGLSLTAFGVSAAKPPLWSIPSMFFTGTAAAASIGLINSLGTLGGFAGPYMVGAGKDLDRGLYWVGGALAVSAITILGMRGFARRQERQI